MTRDHKSLARIYAWEIITDIIRSDMPMHIALRRKMSSIDHMEANDRQLCIRIVHGTIEYLVQSDHIINKFSKIDIDKMDPSIADILRMSIYQLMHMDRIPDYAICDEAVKLTIHCGYIKAKGFVNGILRNIIRHKQSIQLNSPYISYSMPRWIYDKWASDYSKDIADSISSFVLKKSILRLRINTCKISRDDLISTLDINNIKAAPCKIYDDMIEIDDNINIDNLLDICSDKAIIQDISSTIPIRIAGIKKGDRILDICASPGGKSMQAANLLEDDGYIVACDKSDKKVDIIKNNIKKYNFNSIKALTRDATLCDKDMIEMFDIVIADLPCAGLGTISSKPDIKLHMTSDTCDILARLQQDILDNASSYVKKGGKLVYSTCTIDKKENDDNVQIFIDKHKDFSLVPFDINICGNIISGSCDKGYIQIAPDEDNSCDGFFVALLERKESI